MTRVYLAARFSRKDELVGYAAELKQHGIDVQARWLLGGHEFVGVPDEHIAVERQAEFAQDDLDDILRARAIVCFTEPAGAPYARGGRHVEFGFALALAALSVQPIGIVIVGPRENVFYCLPGLVVAPTWESAKRYLVKEFATRKPAAVR